MDKTEERRPVMLSFRLSPAEAEALYNAARQAGKTVSGLCRGLLAPALGTAGKSTELGDPQREVTS